MNFGEMLAWTNRLKGIRSIKDGYIRGERMKVLWSDFSEVYRDSLEISNDSFFIKLYHTMHFEYFIHV